MIVSYRFKDDESVEGYYAGIFNTDKLVVIELTHNDVELTDDTVDRYWMINLVFDGYRDVVLFETMNIGLIDKVFEAITKAIEQKMTQAIENIGAVTVIMPNFS